MKHFLLPLIVLVLLAACGHHTTKSTASGTEKDTTVSATVLPAEGDFYKRFSGTIAGREVVAHITRYGSSISGTYQYPGVSRILDLVPDSTSQNFYRLSETAPGAASDSTPNWEVSLDGAGMHGKWIAANGRTETIELKENYPEGSYHLDAIAIQDSAGLLSTRAEPHATASYTAVFATGTTPAANFINNKLREALSLPANGDIKAAMQSGLKDYFDDYRKDNASLLKDEKDTTMYWTFNFTQEQGLNVLYNDKGFLIIQNFSSEYTGGAHGNYGSSYLCLDVSGSKIWELKDVVADTAALSPLLNLAARNYFKIAPGAAMDNTMLVERVAVTENFYLTPEGLTFVYNPYEIASYADGIVQLFVPYKKLMSLLNPAFKARMHLSESAGVAMRLPVISKRQGLLLKPQSIL